MSQNVRCNKNNVVISAAVGGRGTKGELCVVPGPNSNGNGEQSVSRTVNRWWW